MDNYQHLYEQTKLMLEKYQDEIIPGFREQLERVERERDAAISGLCSVYEYAGLEPGEIEKILERGTPLEGGTAERMKEYLSLGSIDHLRELVQAKKDGRLVVLPCKIGDTVYFVTNGEIKKTEVESIHQWTSDHWKLSTHTDRMSKYWTGYEIDFRGIGKTVFLTREKAEAALEGIAHE